jgi:PKHD-type hydroxylase
MTSFGVTALFKNPTKRNKTMVRQNWRLWKSSIQIDPILNAVETNELTDASTFGGDNKEHRISKVQWLTGYSNIRGLLKPYIFQAADIMGIDVSEYGDIQYTEYHGSDGGKYDWHHDVDWNRDDDHDRKISLTVQLSGPSEYEGGDFSFGDGVESLPDFYKEIGTVLAFPSYLAHKVSPVTSGVRKSLVAWFEGPKWR